MHPYFDLPRPHLFAHRGASGEVPENTLLAFERALSQGTPYLETDCHVTSDGEVVLMHDTTVERTTDGQGEVRELSYAQIQQLDAGYRFTLDGGRYPFRDCGLRVPRLSDALTALPSARFNLEIKASEPAVADQVLRVVRDVGATERVLLTAADDDIAGALHDLAPETALGSSVSDVLSFARAAEAQSLHAHQPRGHALQLPLELWGERVVTRGVVEGAHRLGMLVHVWTVNDPGEIETLLALGVDGIMSDYPALLVRVAGG